MGDVLAWVQINVVVTKVGGTPDYFRNVMDTVILGKYFWSSRQQSLSSKIQTQSAHILDFLVVCQVSLSNGQSHSVVRSDIPKETSR